MSKIRQKAKASGLSLLKGKWLQAGVIILLILILEMGISALDDAYRRAFNVPLDYDQIMLGQQINLSTASFIIALVFSLLTLLLVTPLEFGQKEWFWNLAENKEPPISRVFNWFGSFRLYGKSVLLNLNIAVRSALWTILICGVPFAMIFGAYYMEIHYSDSKYLMISLALSLFGLLLLLGAVFLLIYVLTRYFLAVYLFVEDNTRKTNGVIKESIRISKGYRMEILKFTLSFIGWFFLRQLSYGLLSFYVDPYYYSSSVIFSKHLIYTKRAADKADVAQNTD
ncbi:MAG TPA: DUF975 family protein [Clostridia bacterium]|nr:DUF975 family protein [Clostridia bacterium]